jgi:hypothetical protein
LNEIGFVWSTYEFPGVPASTNHGSSWSMCDVAPSCWMVISLGSFNIELQIGCS